MITSKAYHNRLLSFRQDGDSGRERGEAIELPLCISILNDNVFPLHVTKLAQTLAKCLPAGRASGREVGK